MILLYILALLVCFVLLTHIVDQFFIPSPDKISKNFHFPIDPAGYRARKLFASVVLRQRASGK